ncbi:MAG: BolA family protein [Rickettsiales bacterium]|nr:BolA family protein [Rickettsiales bacterium]
MKQRIEKALKKNLQPQFLEIKNNSQLHLGHFESEESGETHFSIVIESQQLKNLSLIAAHRKINQLLKNEFENGLHALEIKIKT